MGQMQANQFRETLPPAKSFGHIFPPRHHPTALNSTHSWALWGATRLGPDAGGLLGRKAGVPRGDEPVPGHRGGRSPRPLRLPAHSPPAQILGERMAMVLEGTNGHHPPSVPPPPSSSTDLLSLGQLTKVGRGSVKLEKRLPTGSRGPRGGGEIAWTNFEWADSVGNRIRKKISGNPKMNP